MEVEAMVLQVMVAALVLTSWCFGVFCGAGGMHWLIDKLFFNDEKEEEL